MKKGVEQPQSTDTDQDKRLALGRLMEGTVHEVNNPLSIIRMNAELMVEQFKRMGSNVTPELQKIFDRAQKIIAMSDRIAQTMKALRFIGTGSSHEGALDLHIEELLNSLIPLLANRCQKKGVELHAAIVSLGGGSVHVPIAPLAQALITLVNDRIELLQGLPQPWIRLELNPQGKSGIMTITDSGEGADQRAFRMTFPITPAPGFTHD